MSERLGALSVTCYDFSVGRSQAQKGGKGTVSNVVASRTFVQRGRWSGLATTYMYFVAQRADSGFDVKCTVTDVYSARTEHVAGPFGTPQEATRALNSAYLHRHRG